MSWDETQDVLTHRGSLVTDGNDSFSVSVSGFGNDMLQKPARTGGRWKRETIAGNYVRHGKECLEHQAEVVGAERERGRMAGKSVHVVVMMEEGEEARLTCHYCDQHELRGQKETEKEKDVHRSARLWYKLSRKRRLGYYRMKEVKLDMHDDVSKNRVYATDAHTLVVKRSYVKDTGTYFCVDATKKDKIIKPRVSEKRLATFFEADGNLRFLYHLDVLKESEVTATMVATSVQNGTLPIPAKPREMLDKNLRVLTVWEEWSACSICGKPGTRRRLGPCTVQKISANKTVSPLYLDIVVRSYRLGIPCRSSLLRGQKSLRDLLSRPDEVQEEECDVTCDNYEVTVGDLVYKKSNKAKVLVVEEPEGDPVTLKCPRAPVDVPVAWINGTTVLIGPLLRNLNRGRVRIDSNNSLHIAHILPWDSAYYACVIGGEVRGYVKLAVTPKPPPCIVCRYALYLLMSYPFDFAVFCLFLYVRHRERQKVLNYDLLPAAADNNEDDDADEDDESDGSQDSEML